MWSDSEISVWCTVKKLPKKLYTVSDCDQQEQVECCETIKIDSPLAKYVDDEIRHSDETHSALFCIGVTSNEIPWHLTYDTSDLKDHHECGPLIFLRKQTFCIAIVRHQILFIAVICRTGEYNVGIMMLVFDILLYSEINTLLSLWRCPGDIGTVYVILVLSRLSSPECKNSNVFQGITATACVLAIDPKPG